MVYLYLGKEPELREVEAISVGLGRKMFVAENRNRTVFNCWPTFEAAHRPSPVGGKRFDQNLDPVSAGFSSTSVKGVASRRPLAGQHSITGAGKGMRKGIPAVFSPLTHIEKSFSPRSSFRTLAISGFPLQSLTAWIANFLISSSGSQRLTTHNFFPGLKSSEVNGDIEGSSSSA